MPVPTLPKQRPSTASDEPETANGEEPADEQSPDRNRVTGEAVSFEGLIEGMIRAQVGDLERQLDELEQQVEEIDNFARISLNERKIKQSEENLTAFSDSLTSFAERAFNNINALEERLGLHALILASVVEALEEEGVDIDLGEVNRYREPNVVTDTQPEDRLEAALGES
jgi:TolA-binding protein